ncbi:MAG: ATP-binding cassette domain-containing protein [Actinomycetes bacterium]
MSAIIEAQNLGKSYGTVMAIKGISADLNAGEVLCILGDNGAGKSTLIKILSGLHEPSEGKLLIFGQERKFDSPRDALDAGIATVYQDLAVVPLMPIWRNFFLGSEMKKGRGILKRLDVKAMREITKQQLAEMGIILRDVEQPIGTLSGGERQAVAIARAVYFGAKAIILDEPTSALGVKQAGVVLKYIAKARDAGLGVIFITHNPNHAWPVGDKFLLLKLGASIGYFKKSELTIERMTKLMAGADEMADLAHELERKN